MTNNLNGDIKIKTWQFSLAIIIMTGMFTFNTLFASNRQQVQQNTIEISNIKNNEIKRLQDDKADKSEMTQVQITLVRIENKLDNYILINQKK